ncbi:hypothetical protein K457DRAFT_570331 [Linnemannia elongata AG-77]|uniref:Uncharacterized protein n=1 Tax=Linnemannia elongata AG-77 TaxID=1314771 RepID=A0A197KDR3_9FUNG|nr:hypothetical protein K457DRAFT_570331 [Linnemannia elongata AG-77]
MQPDWLLTAIPCLLACLFMSFFVCCMRCKCAVLLLFNVWLCALNHRKKQTKCILSTQPNPTQPNPIQSNPIQCNPIHPCIHVRRTSVSHSLCLCH